MSPADLGGVTMTAPGDVRRFWVFAMLFLGYLPAAAAILGPYRRDRVLAVAAVVVLSVAEIWVVRAHGASGWTWMAAASWCVTAFTPTG
jgi:hypothetical protein